MTVSVTGDAPVKFPATGRRRRGGGAAVEVVVIGPLAAAVRLKTDWCGGG
ncbi:UNVERIFIED_CONTAM: hypothetical protein Sradi_3240600 [Sesamum radiatum]|uniref:Uncharacterized protein n=1 Tax=Sesamum radiatum TaxID=300843 RepID=A0AAW2RIS9_SESRA